MKNRKLTKILSRFSLALALALITVVWSPGQSQSAESAEVKNPAEAKMKEHCQDMKDQKQKMKEDMKAQDAQLTEQLTRMNLAPKDQKMDQMAAVLTRMVEHMQMGKESMAQCPMMKDMKEMDEKPVGATK
jgi:uncharacterized protein HemX